MRIYTPLDSIQNILTYWWLIAFLAVWGGVVAWLFHRTQPPLFEAEAVFNVSIDFNQTGELPPYEVDLAVWGAGGVMLSTPVMERSVAIATAEGIPIDLQTFQARANLERKQARFILSLRHSDPHTAASLVNIWAEQAFATLNDARGHALQAQALRIHLDELQACLQAAEGGADSGLCNQGSLAEIRAELQETSRIINQEQIASQGVLPALVVSLDQMATLPEKPVRYGLNTLVFSGGLIGFLAGVIAVELRIPRRIAGVWRRG